MKTLLLSLLVLGSFISCKKDEPNPDALPPATQDGKNTFGCYINDEVWVPYAPGFLERKITPVFGDWIRIEALRYHESDGSDSEEIVITFKPEPLNEEKTYLFNESNSSALFFNNVTECDYHNENNLAASITITKYDLTEEKVIAGIFEFTLGKDGCETLHFTEGRFDIRVP